MADKIITDSAKLTSYISTTLKTYQSTGTRLHIAIVSAIWHAARHGQPALLDRIYEGLRSNDKQAMKMYIRRAHAIIGFDGKSPEGHTQEEVLAAVAKGQVVDHKQGKFVIVNGHNTKPAQALVKLCEDRFIEPDGETDKMVLDRNNFAEIRVLGDTEILAQIIRLAKSMEGDSERTRVTVSENLKTWFGKVKEEAETRLNQLTLSEG